MPEYFTAETVVEEPFLFVSYSHEDKDITHTMTRYLLDEGVRLWYDTDLAAGDPWPAVIESLITHPKCHGVIMVCSPSAYTSKNVHKERQLALDMQKERSSANYPFFLVNICDDSQSGSYMRLLKSTFEQVPADTIDKLFPIDFLYTLINIIGPDPLCVMTSQEDWCHELLEKGIRRRAKDTIDKGSVALENMHQSAGYSNLSFSFGNFDGPLKWQFVSRDGENGVFLLKSLLPPAYGKGLEQWLNNEFKQKAFTENQRLLLTDKIRLLKGSEAEMLAKSLLQADASWWLQDCIGARQAEVKSEGVVSKLRQLNHQFKRGVRPVITINLADANKLMNEN